MPVIRHNAIRKQPTGRAFQSLGKNLLESLKIAPPLKYPLPRVGAIHYVVNNTANTFSSNPRHESNYKQTRHTVNPK
jgi:hypothetical protein